MSTQPKWEAQLAVRLAWSTPLTEALSAELDTLRTRLLSINKELAEEALVLPVLPDHDDPRLAVVMVRPDDTECNWSLFLATAPAEGEDAPEQDQNGLVPLSEAASVAGGRAALSALITKHWTKPPTVGHNIHFHLPGDTWICRTLPSKVRPNSEDGPVLTIGTDVTVDEIGYRFTNGANGVSRVSIAFREDPHVYHVDVLARGLLRLGDSRWLPFADEVRELIVSSLFEPKQPNV